MTSPSQLTAQMEECVLRGVGQGDGLIIAVLGPTPSDDQQEIFGWKRNQIRNALRGDGHRPFFPEDCTKNDPTLPSLLEQEVLLMSSSVVDLVILFHTESGSGTLQEIGKFDSYPPIVNKTRVLFPMKFFHPGANLFSNTLSEYAVKSPYTDEHLCVCSVLYECRKWASERAKEIWSLMEPQTV